MADGAEKKIIYLPKDSLAIFDAYRIFEKTLKGRD
jgi:hypothetical protein